MTTKTKYTKKQVLDKIQTYDNSQLVEEGFAVEEKIILYNFVIRIIENRPKNSPKEGICTILWMNISNISMSQLQYFFPELYFNKPKDRPDGDYWFDNNEERIVILKKIIEELKLQLK